VGKKNKITNKKGKCEQYLILKGKQKREKKKKERA